MCTGLHTLARILVNIERGSCGAGSLCCRIEGSGRRGENEEEICRRKSGSRRVVESSWVLRPGCGVERQYYDISMMAVVSQNPWASKFHENIPFGALGFSELLRLQKPSR